MAKTIEKFSKALSWVIGEKKVSQKGLAKQLGISPTSITDYKRGNREGSEDTRIKIAAALGYDYQEFLNLGEWIVEGNDGIDFWRNTSSQTNTTKSIGNMAGGINTIHMDESGITLTGYDQRSPPPAVDPDAWVELMHWIIKHPSMVPGLVIEARRIGGIFDSAIPGR